MMFDKFDEYMGHLEWEKAVAERTLAVREAELEQFTEWCRENGIDAVESVGRRQIGGYVEHAADEGYAVSTIMKAKYATLSACFGYLWREGDIEENPLDRLRSSAMKKKARKHIDESEKKEEHGAKDHLTKEEVYELAENVPEPTDRNELLIKLMFWTGARVSEIVQIELDEDGKLGDGSDIDLEEPRIILYEKKSDEARVVSYPRSEINPLLRDWVNHGRLRYKCADRTNRLFAGHKGPLTESGVGRVVRKAAENAGLQEKKSEARDGREYSRVTPHLLRHSHAMHWHNEEDVPLDTIKDHLGHSNLQTTEEYYAESTTEKIVDTFGE